MSDPEKFRHIVRYRTAPDHIDQRMKWGALRDVWRLRLLHIKSGDFGDVRYTSAERTAFVTEFRAVQRQTERLRRFLGEDDYARLLEVQW